MDMQNVSNLQIPEGTVRTIHDKDGRLIWGRVAYNTKYSGDTVQNGTPTPDTPIPVQTVTGEQTVEVTGKNLFDKSSITIGSLVERNTGALSPNNPQYGATDYIKVTPGQSYTYTGFNYWYSAGYDKNKNYVSSLANTATITIPVGVEYIRGSLLLSNLDIAQFEQGSATTYEPYQSYSYPISLGSIELCKIGDYQDYIYKSGADWYVHKEVNKVILNGSEAWSMYSGRNGTFYMAKSDIILAPSIDTTPNVISDHYEPNPFRSLYNMIVDYGVANHNAQHWIAIRNKDYSDVSSFKTWLASNNTTVYYVLATPTDTKITDATLVGQLNDIHEWLTRYGYNDTVAGNLPIIIDKTSL